MQRSRCRDWGNWCGIINLHHAKVFSTAIPVLLRQKRIGYTFVKLRLP